MKQISSTSILFALLIAFLWTLSSPISARKGESAASPTVNDGKYTFVIGDKGYIMESGDDFWTGNVGKNGWTSYDVKGTSNTEEPRIALVSSANVWAFNTGEGGVSTTEYPLIAKLTDLPSIVGPNIHIYNGYIIDKVKIKIYNKYPAVATASGTTNYISLSIGRKAHRASSSNDITEDGPITATQTNIVGAAVSEYDAVEVSYSPFDSGSSDYGDGLNCFSAYSPLPVVIQRSSATSFSRTTYSDGTLQDIYVYCRIEVTVKRVEQRVRYVMFTIDKNGNERMMKKEDPLYYYNASSNYDSITAPTLKDHINELDSVKSNQFTYNSNTYYNSRKYFWDDVTQYVGSTPIIPPMLVRMGCIYGYDKTVIGEKEWIEGESKQRDYCLIKVFFSVDDENLPFHLSSLPATRNKDGSFDYTGYQPEYKYLLRNKFCTKDNAVYYKGKSSNERVYKESALDEKKSNAQSYAFAGTPYNLIVYRCDGTNTGQYPETTSASAAQCFWELLKCREYDTTNKKILDYASKDFFVLRDHQGEIKEFERHMFYYLGYTSSSAVKHSDFKVLYDKTQTTTTETSKHLYAAYHHMDDNGVYYLDVAFANYREYPSIMLTLEGRADNIKVTYKQYLQQADGTYKEQDFHDTQTGDKKDVLRKDMYAGDRVILEAQFIHPYRKYEYFKDADFTEKFSNADGKETTDGDGLIPAAWETDEDKESKVIYVKVSWDTENAPFVLSTADDPQWYYMKLNDKLVSARGYYPYHLESKDSEAEISPMHLWRFERHDDGSIRVVNKWYGNDYSLTNFNGDYNGSTTAYNGYTGPQMKLNTETEKHPWNEEEKTGWSNRWQLLYVSDHEFGLRSYKQNGTTIKGETSMSICDTKEEGLMRYYSNPASLEANSRLRTIKKEEGVLSEIGQAIEDNGVGLKAYIQRTNKQAGQPYGFKEAQSETSGAAAEDVLVNTDSYEKEINGYYRIRWTEKEVTPAIYLQVKANLADAGADAKDVITKEKIRAWLTTESLTDISGINKKANYVFCLENEDTSGKQYHGKTRSQGFTINTTIAAPVTDIDKFKNCESIIYPYGLGKAVMLVNKSTVKNYESGADMQVSYKKATSTDAGKSLMLESAYMSSTPCYLEKVEDFEVGLSQVGSNKYGSVYYPFDIELPEGITAYTCSRINEEAQTVELQQLIDSDGNPTQTVPANSAVVLIGAEDSNGTVTIKGNKPDNAFVLGNSANKFAGTHYNFTVPKVDGWENLESLEGEEKEKMEKEIDDHDVVRLFGKGGAANTPGFYPFVLDKNMNVPANKAYINWGSTSEEEVEAHGVAPYLLLSFTKGNIVRLHINETGYNTYYNSRPLQLPEGLEAAIVTTSTDGKQLEINWCYPEGSIVPGGTGILLRGEMDTDFEAYLLNEDEGETAPAENLLRGSDTTTLTFGNGRHFQFTTDESGEVGFYPAAGEGEPFFCEAHKAWLVLPAQMNIAGWNINKNTTGLLAPTTHSDNILYDLSGRPANKKTAPKGVYIESNGRKVVR